MLRLPLIPFSRSRFKILCLGAHSDDIEIGCGGTMLHLVHSYPQLDIRWVVFSASPEREREARKSARLFLRGAKKQELIVKNFRESYFPYVGPEIKEFFEELKADFDPDLIFTHTRHDLHQDHRILWELTWNAFRNHTILEYEIPKYDGDLAAPHCFMPLSEKLCVRKINYLMEAFKTQRSKHWFTPDTFQALMRLRGLESNAPENFAEGFYCRKLSF